MLLLPLSPAHTCTPISLQQRCGWWMALQSVIKAGEWSWVAERWCNTTLRPEPSGSGYSCLSSPPLLFICSVLELITQACLKSLCVLIGVNLLSTAVFNKKLLQRESIHMFSIHASRGRIGNYSLLCCFCRRLFVLLDLIHCNCLGLREGSWL